MEGSVPQSIFSIGGVPLKWIMEWAFKLLHLEGFPETISLCIVLGMIFFITRCWLGLRTLNTSLQSCSNALGRIDPTEKFFDNSQEFESAVNNSPQSLRDCWKKFRATLVEHRTSVFLTANPIDFFNICGLFSILFTKKMKRHLFFWRHVNISLCSQCYCKSAIICNVCPSLSMGKPLVPFVNVMSTHFKMRMITLTLLFSHQKPQVSD